MLIRLGILFWFTVGILQGQTSLDTALNFSVQDIGGKSYSLFECLDQGQYVVLVFFSTQYPSCTGIIPDLNTIYSEYGCNNGQVFFLAIDHGSTQQELLSYKQTYGSLLPQISGVNGGGDEVFDLYNIGAFPTVVLIAPNRSILNQDIFPVTAGYLEYYLTFQAEIEPDPTGCLTNVVQEVTSYAEISNSLKLFPNPTDGLPTHLSIILPYPGLVEIDLHGSRGNSPVHLVKTRYPAGNQKIELPFSDWMPWQVLEIRFESKTVGSVSLVKGM
ncbi:MAG: redoxin domain-containing protein [Saprospirales bacterium]|nr:redoxin domain-containing protein [Saprospirales bacterium]MBK8492109.1 redoxin domain-containing protein [Saprospirales bacterium]